MSNHVLIDGGECSAGAAVVRKVVSACLAGALCVGLCPAFSQMAVAADGDDGAADVAAAVSVVAGADAGVVAGADAAAADVQIATLAQNVSVALTVVDSTDGGAGAIVNIPVTNLTTDNTVADLLTAAGFTAGTVEESAAAPQSVYFESWGYPGFAGKETTQADDGTYVYWACFVDGAADYSGATALTANLVDGNYYQFVYGSGQDFSYSDEIARPELPSQDNANEGAGSDGAGSEGAGEGTSGEGSAGTTGSNASGAQVPAADSQSIQTLLANLTARFSTGGADASIMPTTANAAVALGSLGKGSSLDTAAIKANFASYEVKNGTAMGAGQYGKFIMMLTAAGVDCAAVTFDGSAEAQNLVAQMEAKVASASSISVYDAVWILPVYGHYSYGDKTGTTAAAARDAILAAQSSAGLFGISGYEDLQTTAQAILALSPYKSDAKVAAAIDAAKAALLANQNADGGFPYNAGGASDVDTTANTVAALAALGVSPKAAAAGGVTTLSTDSAQAASAMDFIMSKADSDLTGFNAAGSWDESITSSTVLLALAANAGYDAAGGTFDVYAPYKAAAAGSDTAAATTASTPAATSASGEGSKLAATGDASATAGGALVLCGLAALGGACALRRRRSQAAAVSGAGAEGK